MAGWALAVVGLFAGASGCSVVVDANRAQCSTDNDCSARGAQFAGTVCVDSVCQVSTNWACLQQPPRPAAAGDQFRVSFNVVDTVTQKPKAGITARLCRKLDVACTDTLSAVGTVDAQGSIAFQVENEFDGYVRFEGGDSLPGLYFFNPPVTRDTLDITIQLSAPSTLAGLAALTGATQDSGRGIVLLSVADCTGAPAIGAALSASPQDDMAKTFYAEQGFPSSLARMTDDSGYGGFVNASPGTLLISAFRSVSGEKIDDVTVLVQPGTQTMTRLVPDGS